MRHALRASIALSCGALTSAACLSSDDPAPRGIAVAVAPLTLPGLGVACYDVQVTTASDVVWTRGTRFLTRLGHDQSEPADALGPVVGAPDTDSVCSDQFGNGEGGAVSYVGPCDASAGADTVSGGSVQNTVTLWVDGLYTAGAAAELGEWQDPCPDGCALQIDCAENADTPAEFNLTIMRDANQGFFDVAVNFDDVFCSAKLDTCYDRGVAEDRIQLLHRDSDGDGTPDTRWDTGVLAFACTGGPGADTHLYLDSVTIACDTGTFQLDPSQPEAGNVAAPVGQDVVFGYATYFGREDLNCPAADGSGATGGSCKKKYWTMAIGFDTDADHRFDDDTCTLYASATASDGELGDDWVTPPRTAYPVIRFAVPLSAGESLELTCGHWGLDEEDGGPVHTAYTSLACVGADGPQSELAGGAPDDCDFCHHMNGVDPEQSARAECNATAVICGDDSCDDGESCESCPGDCGACPAGVIQVHLVPPDCDFSGSNDFFDLLCYQNEWSQGSAEGVPGVDVQVLTTEGTLVASGTTQTPTLEAGAIMFSGLAEETCFHVQIDVSDVDALWEVYDGTFFSPIDPPYEVCTSADDIQRIYFWVDPVGSEFGEDCGLIQQGSGWDMPAEAPACELSSASLSGADLTGANLSGSMLADADLTFSTLIGADLSYAMMSGALLNGSDLTDTIFVGADLSGAHFGDCASTAGADFSDASLSDADVSGTVDCDFAGAIMNGYTTCPDGTLATNPGSGFTCARATSSP